MVVILSHWWWNGRILLVGFVVVNHQNIQNGFAGSQALTGAAAGALRLFGLLGRRRLRFYGLLGLLGQVVQNGFSTANLCGRAAQLPLPTTDCRQGPGGRRATRRGLKRL